MIIQADARHIPLADESVHCVITSPPYFGLRDYGTGHWHGGSSACDHIASEIRTGIGLAKLGEKYRGGGHKQGTVTGIPYRDVCGKCGADRVDQQIGLEPSPEEYVQSMVQVFREVWRVLRPDGTLWLNLGDSYANDGKWGGHTGGKHAKSLHCSPIGRNKRYTGLKPKDLIGIPWRVAFALQEDGWYLRQDIIWHKPNPMPESVRDRCTKSHEYLFLLSKSERYYWNAEEMKEPTTGNSHSRGNGVNPKAKQFGKNSKVLVDHSPRTRPRQNESFSAAVWGLVDRRNRRSVWTVSTKPYRGAHFATFPPDLIDPCIRTGCPPGGIVFDPFAGAATTWLVAAALGRQFFGIELNSEYIRMAIARVAGQKARPKRIERPAQRELFVEIAG